MRRRLLFLLLVPVSGCAAAAWIELRGPHGEGAAPAGVQEEAAAAYVPPTGAVASVNGRAIDAERFNARLARLAGDVTRLPPDGARRQARLLLDRMEEAELIAQALAGAGAGVTDREVDEAFAALSPSGGKGDLAAELRREGVSLDEVRAELRDRIARRKLVAAQPAEPVADAEVEAEVVRGASAPASVAVVEAYVARVAPNAPPDARVRARSAAEEFAAAVTRDGSPAQAAERSGLAAMPRFELPQGAGEPALEGAVFALAPGAWAPPVETRAGIVVARLVEQRTATVRAGADAREEARRALVARRRQESERELLANLRARARIEEHVTF